MHDANDKTIRLCRHTVEQKRGRNYLGTINCLTIADAIFRWSMHQIQMAAMPSHGIGKQRITSSAAAIDHLWNARYANTVLTGPAVGAEPVQGAGW